MRRLVTGDSTSVTDDDGYRAFCDIAAGDPYAFSAFRRHEIVVGVLEHVSQAEGLESIEAALNQCPQYEGMLEEFRRNDSIGGPVLQRFEGIGDWSPTTLRYIKILSDLESLFGDLAGMHIVEIGAGYGGQCRIIHARFTPGSYTILDLPEPGRLAGRYLTAVGVGQVSINPPLEDLRRKRIDLVISNYALSEIRRSVQQQYLDSVVLHAARGYMLWNNLAVRRKSEKRFSLADQPLSAEEVSGLVPGASVVRNGPLILRSDVGFANALVLWGERRT